MKFALTLLLTLIAFSQVQASTSFTYEGYLTDDNGNLLSAPVPVEFEIIGSSGGPECVLYRELHAAVDVTVNANFSLKVGSGSSSFGNSTNFPAYFANTSSAIPGESCVFNPNLATSKRFLRVKVDGNLLGDVDLTDAPRALVADRVGTAKESNLLRVQDSAAPSNTNSLSAANLTEFWNLINGTSTAYEKSGQLNGMSVPSLTTGQALRSTGSGWQAYTPLTAETDPTVQGFAKSALPTCAVNEVLKSNGTTFVCVADQSGWSSVDATASTKGIVSVPAAGGLSVAAGEISLPNIGTIGSYPKVTVDAKGRVTSGTTLVETDIPNLSGAGKVSGSAITSGTISGATAWNSTGNIATTGSLTAASVSSTSSSTQDSRLFDADLSNYISLKSPSVLSTNYALTLPPDKGNSGQVLTTDGSGVLSWTTPVTGGGGGGTVTQVSAGTGLAGGPITGSGTLSIANAGVGSAQIAPNAVDATHIADGSVTDVKVAAVSAAKITSAVGGYLGYKPNNSPCANNQILKWDGTNSRWICGAAALTTAAEVSAAYGYTPVSSARSIATGTGLTGGGDLSADRTLAVNVGTAANQIPQLDGSGKLQSSVLPNIGIANLKTSIGTAQFTDATCSASQTLTWSSLTDQFYCSSIMVGTANLASGAVTSAKLASSVADGLWTASAGNISRLSGNVGVGTDMPTSQFEVMSSDNNAAFATVTSQSANSGGASGVLLRRSRGTMASRTATQSGDAIGNISAVGYGDTGFQTSARVSFEAAENMTNTARGTSISFYTTPQGSAAQNLRMNIHANGGVSVGGSTPDSSALLDLNSTTRGLLLPRMTTVQRDAIVSPANGLQIFNTTTGSVNYYSGGWQSVGVGGGAGIVSLTGDVTASGNGSVAATIANGAVTSGKILDGTIVAADLDTTLTSRMWTESSGSVYRSTGNVGIGTTAPGRPLHVVGGMRLAPMSLPTGATGDIAYDTSDSKMKYYNGTAWQVMAADNMGNQVASGNIQLNGNWLSNGASANGIQIDSSGKIGINKTSPSAALDVNGSGQFSGSVSATTLTASGSGVVVPGGTPASPTYSFAGSSGTGLSMPATNSISISSGGAESVRVDSSGNVGVGTTAPDTRLHVVGDIKATGKVLGATNVRALAASSTPANYGGSTFALIPSMSLTFTSAAVPVMMLVNMDCYHNNGQPTVDGLKGAAYFAIFVDNVEKVRRSIEFVGTKVAPISINHMQTMTAGSHTVEVRWLNRDLTASSGIFCSFENTTRSLMVWE